MEIRNVSALVTGGGSGLGAATAAALAAGGAKVAVIDRNREAAEDVARRIGGLPVVLDVADERQAMAGLAAARERHGPARILVNCAGIATGNRIVGKDGPMPLDGFERVIRINLIGTFNMLRLAAADMTSLEPLADEARGVIVMTASVAAFEGQVGQAAYSASKGGVAAMTMPASRELARFGIRVFTIAPGLFLTPLLESLPGSPPPFPSRGDWGHRRISPTSLWPASGTATSTAKSSVSTAPCAWRPAEKIARRIKRPGGLTAGP